MSEENTKLGIFWGEASLCCVETLATQAKQIFQIPFQSKTISSAEGEVSFLLEEVDSIQKIFQQNNIDSPVINLSLPTKDIIFRSFVIPWMQSSEVESVVKFESVKYIPFSLDDLVYTYHSLSVIEDSVRRIRVIFVAIKKKILEGYINALNQINLTAITAEPAALSLIRVLVFKGVIPQDQTVALIEQEGDMGMIIVVVQGIPQFVREFPLNSNLSDQKQLEGDLIELQRKKFINEIRISLDYFNRQNSQLQIKQIVLLDLENSKDAFKILEEDFAVPVVIIDNQTIFGLQEGKDSGFVSAYGAGVLGSVDFPVEFNFIQGGSSLPRASNAFIEKSVNYKSTVIIAGGSLIFLIGAFFLSNSLLIKDKKAIEVLRQELGAFVDSSDDFFKTKKEILEHKFNNLKNIRKETQIAFFLAAIPDMLPNGMWLKELDIRYEPLSEVKSKKKKNKIRGVTRKEDRLVIFMEGYVYLENTRGQFKLINEVLKNFKKNKVFSEMFSEIKLETSKTDQLDERTVTTFSIRCQ